MGIPAGLQSPLPLFWRYCSTLALCNHPPSHPPARLKKVTSSAGEAASRFGGDITHSAALLCRSAASGQPSQRSRRASQQLLCLRRFQATAMSCKCRCTEESGW